VISKVIINSNGLLHQIHGGMIYLIENLSTCEENRFWLCLEGLMLQHCWENPRQSDAMYWYILLLFML